MHHDHYDLLIRDTTVLPMRSGSEVLPRHDVGVLGNTIVLVEPTIDVSPDAKTIIDGRKYVLIPGLINGHTHVGQTFLKATTECMALKPWLEWNNERLVRMTPEDVHYAALLAIIEMIQNGVTTFNDMFFFEEAIAEAVELSGVRACLGQGIMEYTQEMGNLNVPGRHLEDSTAFAQKWNGKAGGRINTRLAPHSLYTVSENTLKETAACAQDLGLGIHTHLSETQLEIEFSQSTFGATPPTKYSEWGYMDVPFIAAHCVHLDSEDIDTLNVPGVGVAHNPTSNLKLRSGKAPVELLIDLEDLAVGIGTDSAASNDCLDILKEAHVAALIHDWEYGSPASLIALRMATIEGARALGMDNEIGSVEVGKKADLVLVDTDTPRFTPRNNIVHQLVYSALSRDIVTVIVDGQIVMQDKEICTLDVKNVLEKARERADRIHKNTLPNG